jgi:hypothetical protein
LTLLRRLTADGRAPGRRGQERSMPVAALIKAWKGALPRFRIGRQHRRIGGKFERDILHK